MTITPQGALPLLCPSMGARQNAGMPVAVLVGGALLLSGCASIGNEAGPPEGTTSAKKVETTGPATTASTRTAPAPGPAADPSPLESPTPDHSQAGGETRQQPVGPQRSAAPILDPAGGSVPTEPNEASANEPATTARSSQSGTTQPPVLKMSSRSDVRMSIESRPGTTGRRLQGMAAPLGAALGGIKRCYGGIVQKDPTVVGTLEADVELTVQGRVKLTTTGKWVRHGALRECIQTHLQTVSFNGVRPPARVGMVLQLDNTLARDATEVAARRALGAQVQISRDARGRPFSEARTALGEISFTLRGSKRFSDKSQASTHRALVNAMPALLDCRRRAGRRGRSPVGDIKLRVQIKRRGNPSVKLVHSNVEHPRAGLCARAATRRASFANLPGHFDLELRFRPARKPH